MHSYNTMNALQGSLMLRQWDSEMLFIHLDIIFSWVYPCFHYNPEEKSKRVILHFLQCWEWPLKTAKVVLCTSVLLAVRMSDDWNVMVRGENVYKVLQRPAQLSSSLTDSDPSGVVKEKKSPLTHFNVNGGFRVWTKLGYFPH